ncbi:MAG: hypothetical protein V4622_09795 [Bacteroidota bacterium]
MKKLLILTLLILAFHLTSCMSILQSIYGIKDPKIISDTEIIKSSKKFKVDQNTSYKLDTSYYSFIINLDTNLFKVQRKNHIQPLQALYFNSQGELVKFYINCYAGGFPNLDWNRDGNLETFLPKDQAPVDTILNLQKLVNFLRPVKTSTNQDFENQDYNVFVFWSKCTKRHSKRLIRSIKENISLAKSTKVKIYYVNYDNVFYRLENM